MGYLAICFGLLSIHASFTRMDRELADFCITISVLLGCAAMGVEAAQLWIWIKDAATQ